LALFGDGAGRLAAVVAVPEVSDNESWIDVRAGRGTATMEEWSRFKARNPQARLVCIDLQPYGTTQAPDREDVLNVGGFSDQVFDVIAAFRRDGGDADPWAKAIEWKSRNVSATLAGASSVQ
jgi:60 kDa SS-A/Ro ribonucleoprotein